MSKIDLSIEQINLLLYAAQKGIKIDHWEDVVSVLSFEIDWENQFYGIEIIINKNNECEEGFFEYDHSVLEVPFKAIECSDLIKERNRIVCRGNLEVWIKYNKLSSYPSKQLQKKATTLNLEWNKIKKELAAFKLAYETTQSTTLLKLINDHEMLLKDLPIRIEQVQNKLTQIEKVKNDWKIIEQGGNFMDVGQWVKENE